MCKKAVSLFIVSVLNKTISLKLNKLYLHDVYAYEVRMIAYTMYGLNEVDVIIDVRALHSLSYAYDDDDVHVHQ